MNDKPRRGRKPIDPRLRRCRPVYAMLTEAEVEWLDKQAHDMGISRYRWVRDRLLAGLAAYVEDQ